MSDLSYEARQQEYAKGKWSAALGRRGAGERRYWLVKSEPETFSWDDLLRAPDRTTHWNGVRNYVARNFLRDGMRAGDRVFFYHSSTDPQAIVGIAEVARDSYPDFTATDPKSETYDEGSDADAPTWWMVDLRAVEPLARPVTLREMKANAALAEMTLLKIGRLSVTPVTDAEWATIIAMSKAPAVSGAATTPKKPAAKKVAAKKSAATSAAKTGARTSTKSPAKKSSKRS